MSYNNKKVITVLIVFFLPSILSAAALVPDCGGQPCSLEKLGTLFGNVMQFLISDILVPISIISLAIIGYQYLTAMGNPGKLAKVHELFLNVLWGILVALAAWAVIELIFTTLSGESFTKYLL